MIKAKKLMLGNYVTIDNEKCWSKLKGKPMKVTSISERTDCDFPEATHSISLVSSDSYYESYSQFNHFVSPIELTIDILINNCGFAKEKSNYSLDSYVIFAPRGDNKPIIEVCLYVNENGYFETGDDLPMLHLHQLQNYYESKTGEELDINLK